MGWLFPISEPSRSTCARVTFSFGMMAPPRPPSKKPVRAASSNTKSGCEGPPAKTASRDAIPPRRSWLGGIGAVNLLLWKTGVWKASAILMSSLSVPLAPVPVMMTGRFAFDQALIRVSTAAGSGAELNAEGTLTAPYAIRAIWGGVKSTSIGKSIKTGPLIPEFAARKAYATIRGISSTLVTRWENLVMGLETTTWSWKPCKAFVSASWRGGEEVTQKTGERSAKAVARPASPFAKLLEE